MQDTVQKKEKWLVVKTPMGHYAKVHGSVRFIIPETWEVFTSGFLFFKKNGDLKPMAMGMIRLESKEHAQWYGSPLSHDFGMILKTIFNK